MGVIYDQIALGTERKDLVEACQEGDEAAFRTLYHAHRGEVHRVVFRLLGPSDDLEDIIQEVFLQVHRSIHNFRGRSKFSTWLHRVAVNVALQHIRRKRSTLKSRPDEKIDERPDDDPNRRTPLENVEVKDRQRAVNEILDELAPKKRIVLVLHDVEGKSAKEVSELVGAPIFTVRTRLFYARREFYKKIVSHPAFAGDISAAQLLRK